MSVHVRHLNADSSFYLTFSPPCAPQPADGYFPGTFTVLIDPWLSGASSILSPKFASSVHTTPACVQSLADLPDPDLVVVSQDKSDHCHIETIQQLPCSTRASFLGPAAAIRKIRGLKRFNPNNIHALRRYDEKKPESLFRIPIAACSPNGSCGEVTIALLANKVDLKGLHNAIGITYRPPSAVGAHSSSPSHFTLPLTPPETPPTSSEYLPPIGGEIPTTPASTSLTPFSSSPSSPRQRTISLLYSPHGVEFRVVKPYASSHLMAEAALPLTAMFHSMDRATNPWYFGGNICAGTPGGIELATNLLAKHWIAAHDEDKENSGISVRNCRVVKYDMDEISELIGHAVSSHSKTVDGRSCPTRLHCLGSGEALFIPTR